MNNDKWFYGLVALSVAAVAYLSLYTLNQTEQAVITQFGRPIGDPVKEPGLHVKVPLIQQVNYFDKRYLAWDGPMVEMSTKDKTYLEVDTFARWRIIDPLRYYLRLRDERSAQSRLEDILGSETRTAVARQELIEVVRTTKERTPMQDDTLAESGLGNNLKPITVGRTGVEQGIINAAAPKLAEFGIELLDVRFKRINYNQQVLDRIHQRMISERLQIAQRFRSEGEGEAARIIGNKQRDINQIESEAYKRAQEIQGEADAQAVQIYAKAYGQSADAVELFKFLKTMDTYRKVIKQDTSIVLSTNSELYSGLKRDVQKNR